LPDVLLSFLARAIPGSLPTGAAAAFLASGLLLQLRQRLQSGRL